MPPRDSARPRPVAFHDDAPRPGRHDAFDGTVPPVLRTAFDVTAYTLEVGGRIPVDATAIGRAAERMTGNTPVDDGAPTASTGDAAPAVPADVLDLASLRRDLAYLHRIESAALTETRTMYSSWTANEARITAFAASWLWERFWWARSLREVRDALPATPERPREDRPQHEHPRPTPLHRARHLYVERALPMVGPVWAAVTGERVTAGHMARMAIQEGSLLVALRALSARLDHIPEAQRVIDEICRRRERAAEFFRLEAIARITRSRGEALTARLVLATGGDPLRPAGQWVPGELEARRSLFAAPESRAALDAVRAEITRLLPGRGLPSPRRPSAPGGSRGIRP